MEYLQLIAGRHSVRKFKNIEVPRGILDVIIEEARMAPSSRNSKSSEFMVVEDPDTIAALSEMRTSGSSFLKDAAAAIIVLGDGTKTDLWEVNCAISTTFIQLSAVEHGLGSCWVHVAGRPRSKDGSIPGLAEDYVRELLGVKPEFRILCVVAIGYPDE